MGNITRRDIDDTIKPHISLRGKLTRSRSFSNAPTDKGETDIGGFAVTTNLCVYAAEAAAIIFFHSR